MIFGRLLQKYLDIRPGEGKQVGLMSVYVFLLISDILMVKSVSTSFFLSRIGIEKLPVAFILVATASVIIFSVFTRHQGTAGLYGQMQGTLVLSVVSLLAFRVVLLQPLYSSPFYYFLYVGGALFGVTVSAQFWLLANSFYTAREAKRFFSVFGSAAIAGGIFGGYATKILLFRLSSENLLIVAAGLLIVGVFIVRSIFKRSGPAAYIAREPSAIRLHCKKKKERPLHSITSSGLLSSAMLLIGLGVVSATFIDYQFNALASEKIADPDRLAGFIGFWLSTLSLVSFVIQVFLTSRIVNTFGVCSSLGILPVGILVGAFGVILNPTLIPVVFLKVIGGSLRNSTHKSSLELLVVPVPVQTKQQVKTFTDVVSDNVATGISGVLLIVFTEMFGFSVRELSAILVLLAGMQMVIILNARKHYVNTFREAIKKREINFSAEVTAIRDTRVKEALLNDLDTFSERQLLFVLQLVTSIESESVFWKVAALLHHRNTEIRCKAVSLLATYEKHDATAMMRELLDDADCTIQMHALHYLALKSGDPGRYLAGYLGECDDSACAAALLCAGHELSVHPEDGSLDAVFSSTVLDLLNNVSSATAMITAANAIAVSGRSRLYPYLLRLFDHPDPEVQMAAVIAGGNCRYQPALSPIVSRLTDRNLRPAARSALVHFGVSLLPEAVKIISNENVAVRTRRELIRAIGEIHVQVSADTLLTLLNMHHQTLTSDIIRSLERLRNEAPALTFSSEKADSFVQYTIGKYRVYRSVLSVLQEKLHTDTLMQTNDIRQARVLLVRALEEKLSDCIRNIFKTLGLYYHRKDMTYAYQGLKSNDRYTSAQALEFLESVLRKTCKRTLMPVVEDYVMRKTENSPLSQQSHSPSSESTALMTLLDYSDYWIHACSLFLYGTIKSPEYMESIRKHYNHSNPVIRETVRRVAPSFNNLNEDSYTRC